jgi:hypothetical protein
MVGENPRDAADQQDAFWISVQICSHDRSVRPRGAPRDHPSQDASHSQLLALDLPKMGSHVEKLVT